MRRVDIGALRVLLDAMTPGPWRGDPLGEPTDSWTIDADGWEQLAVVNGNEEDESLHEQGEANAEGIIQLRNAAPALIAELEAARAVVRAARPGSGPHHNEDAMDDAIEEYDRLVKESAP
jgi:hypothetical protein